MNLQSDLILAKQAACQCIGQNFYVTKQGIKRDFNLFGGSYEFKVYFKEGLYVEDFEGKKITKPEPKARVSSKLRDTAPQADGEDVE